MKKYAIFEGIASDDRPQATALMTLETAVEGVWIDYNGHMTEWQYYKIMADSGENFLRAAGFTEEYRTSGYSFFSVEGHMRNLRECRVGTKLQVFTDMIGFDETRLQIYQYVVDVGREITLATCEHMMLHVDTNIRKRVALLPYMAEQLDNAMSEWAPPLRPKGLSAAVTACWQLQQPVEGFLSNNRPTALDDWTNMPRIVDHNERRRQICDVLLDIVAESGLGAATLREVADSVRLGRPESSATIAMAAMTSCSGAKAKPLNSLPSITPRCSRALMDCRRWNSCLRPVFLSTSVGWLCSHIYSSFAEAMTDNFLRQEVESYWSSGAKRSHGHSTCPRDRRFSFGRRRQGDCERSARPCRRHGHARAAGSRRHGAFARAIAGTLLDTAFGAEDRRSNSARRHSRPPNNRSSDLTRKPPTNGTYQWPI